MTDPQPDPARARFVVLAAIRVMGVVMVLLGLMTMADRLPLPRVVGLPFVLMGLFEALFIPLLLAKQWKSPKE